MKTLLSILFAINICIATKAQTPDKVLARVRYTYTNNSDTLKNEKLRSENMLLFIGRNTSLFTSYDRINHQLAIDQKIRAKMRTMVDNGKPLSIKIDESESEWMSTTNHLYFINENKHITKEVIADMNYVIEEKIPVITWDIKKDTMSFSGIKCQKATAEFEEKNWIAWFAEELPFRTGPWQLNGLPGLIVEAYDEQKSSYFKFAGIENAKEGDFKRFNDITKGINAGEGFINALDVMLGFDVADAYFSNVIQVPNVYTIKTTKQQLIKFKEAYKRDPKAFKNK